MAQRPPTTGQLCRGRRAGILQSCEHVRTDPSSSKATRSARLRTMANTSAHSAPGPGVGCLLADACIPYPQSKDPSRGEGASPPQPAVSLQLHTQPRPHRDQDEDPRMQQLSPLLTPLGATRTGYGVGRDWPPLDGSAVDNSGTRGSEPQGGSGGDEEGGAYGGQHSPQSRLGRPNRGAVAGRPHPPPPFPSPPGLYPQQPPYHPQDVQHQRSEHVRAVPHRYHFRQQPQRRRVTHPGGHHGQHHAYPSHHTALIHARHCLSRALASATHPDQLLQLLAAALGPQYHQQHPHLPLTQQGGGLIDPVCVSAAVCCMARLEQGAAAATAGSSGDPASGIALGAVWQGPQSWGRGGGQGLGYRPTGQWSPEHRPELGRVDVVTATAAGGWAAQGRRDIGRWDAGPQSGADGGGGDGSGMREGAAAGGPRMWSTVQSTPSLGGSVATGAAPTSGRGAPLPGGGAVAPSRWVPESGGGGFGSSPDAGPWCAGGDFPGASPSRSEPATSGGGGPPAGVGGDRMPPGVTAAGAGSPQQMFPGHTAGARLTQEQLRRRQRINRFLRLVGSALQQCWEANAGTAPAAAAAATAFGVAAAAAATPTPTGDTSAPALGGVAAAAPSYLTGPVGCSGDTMDGRSNILTTGVAAAAAQPVATGTAAVTPTVHRLCTPTTTTATASPHLEHSAIAAFRAAAATASEAAAFTPPPPASAFASSSGPYRAPVRPFRPREIANVAWGLASLRTVDKRLCGFPGTVQSALLRQIQDLLPPPLPAPPQTVMRPRRSQNAADAAVSAALSAGGRLSGSGVGTERGGDGARQDARIVWPRRGCEGTGRPALSASASTADSSRAYGGTFGDNSGGSGSGNSSWSRQGSPEAGAAGDTGAGGGDVGGCMSLESTSEPVPRWAPGELAMTAWAMARADVAPPSRRWLLSYLAAWDEQTLAAAAPSELACLAWALARWQRKAEGLQDWWRGRRKPRTPPTITAAAATGASYGVRGVVLGVRHHQRRRHQGRSRRRGERRSGVLETVPVRLLLPASWLQSFWAVSLEGLQRTAAAAAAAGAVAAAAGLPPSGGAPALRARSPHGRLELNDPEAARQRQVRFSALVGHYYHRQRSHILARAGTPVRGGGTSSTANTASGSSTGSSRVSSTGSSSVSSTGSSSGSSTASSSFGGAAGQGAGSGVASRSNTDAASAAPVAASWAALPPAPAAAAAAAPSQPWEPCELAMLLWSVAALRLSPPDAWAEAGLRAAAGWAPAVPPLALATTLLGAARLGQQAPGTPLSPPTGHLHAVHAVQTGQHSPGAGGAVAGSGLARHADAPSAATDSPVVALGTLAGVATATVAPETLHKASLPPPPAPLLSALRSPPASLPPPVPPTCRPCRPPPPPPPPVPVPCPSLLSAFARSYLGRCAASLESFGPSHVVNLLAALQVLVASGHLPPPGALPLPLPALLDSAAARLQRCYAAGLGTRHLVAAAAHLAALRHTPPAEWRDWWLDEIYDSFRAGKKLRVHELEAVLRALTSFRVVPGRTWTGALLGAAARRLPYMGRTSMTRLLEAMAAAGLRLNRPDQHQQQRSAQPTTQQQQNPTQHPGTQPDAAGRLSERDLGSSGGEAGSEGVEWSWLTLYLRLWAGRGGRQHMLRTEPLPVSAEQAARLCSALLPLAGPVPFWPLGPRTALQAALRRSPALSRLRHRPQHSRRQHPAAGGTSSKGGKEAGKGVSQSGGCSGGGGKGVSQSGGCSGGGGKGVSQSGGCSGGGVAQSGSCAAGGAVAGGGGRQKSGRRKPKAAAAGGGGAGGDRKPGKGAPPGGLGSAAAPACPDAVATTGSPGSTSVPLPSNAVTVDGGRSDVGGGGGRRGTGLGSSGAEGRRGRDHRNRHQCKAATDSAGKGAGPDAPHGGSSTAVVGPGTSGPGKGMGHSGTGRCGRGGSGDDPGFRVREDAPAHRERVLRWRQQLAALQEAMARLGLDGGRC